MATRYLRVLALLLPVAGADVARAAEPPPATEAAVTIVRGPGSGPLPRLEASAAPQVLAGDRLWLVDQAAGTVVSCRNVGTANVGQRRVRCTRGSLPVD